MKIVIAGAGSVGRSVALELLAHGHDITLIDNMPEKLRISSVADADWVLADACSPDALHDAGVDEADVMVAATGDDKANLVISLLAKTEFAVPRVVARLNNPKNEWLFDQAWGVDVSVSTPRIMTSLVEEAVSVGIPVRLFSFNTAAVSMHALILPDDSPVVGKRVHSLELPARSVLAALLRDGRPITPSADDVFEASDELLLLVPDADAQELTKLRQLVASPEPEASSEGEEEPRRPHQVAQAPRAKSGRPRASLATPSAATWPLSHRGT